MTKSLPALICACFGFLLAGARLAGAQALFGAPSAISVTPTPAGGFTQSLSLTSGAALNTAGGIDIVPSATSTSINFTVSRPFSLSSAGSYAITSAFDGYFWSSTQYTSQSVDGVLVKTSILDASGTLVTHVDCYPSFMGFATLPPIAAIPYVPTSNTAPSAGAHVTADLMSSSPIALTVTDPLQPYTLKQDVTLNITTFGLQPGALPTHLYVTSASNLVQPRAGVPEPSAFMFALVGAACMTVCAWQARRRNTPV